jgi:long-chain acyl-CoA synthetase
LDSSINHAHLTVVFATSEHMPTILKLAHKVPMLKSIVCIDPLLSDAAKLLREWSSTVGLVFRELSEGEFFFFLSFFPPFSVPFVLLL